MLILVCIILEICYGQIILVSCLPNMLNYGSVSNDFAVFMSPRKQVYLRSPAPIIQRDFSTRISSQYDKCPWGVKSPRLTCNPTLQVLRNLRLFSATWCCQFLSATIPYMHSYFAHLPSKIWLRNPKRGNSKLVSPLSLALLFPKWFGLLVLFYP